MIWFNLPSAAFDIDREMKLWAVLFSMVSWEACQKDLYRWLKPKKGKRFYTSPLIELMPLKG